MGIFGRCPHSGNGGRHRQCTKSDCGHYRKRVRHCICGARY